jgi:hypothetical protein
MSNSGPDPARLRQLRDRFETAAYDSPKLRAVVLYQPPFRSLDGCGPAIDTSEPFFEGFVRGRKLLRDVGHYAVTTPPFSPRDSDRPTDNTDIEGIVRATWEMDPRCEKGHWWPHLGPAPDLEKERFAMLGEDAARLVRCDNRRGGTPPGDWLVYIAERAGSLFHMGAKRCLFESLPIIPGARPLPQGFQIRRASVDSPALPLPHTPSWWVIEFSNVFLLSRNVIEAELQRAQTEGSLPA